MTNKRETIFAVSTGTIKAALAVIRISGQDSYDCVKKISSNMPKKNNFACFNKIFSNDGLIIDQTITTYFKSPKSFTGEDMVEISVHGSGAVVKKIITTLLESNKIRMALPGEFTRRAFENNKLDLTQVEAVADLVNAETEMQRKQAISHLSGHFFKSMKETFEQLKKVLANIEAIIDFTEEDLPENLLNEIKEQIKNIILKIQKSLRGSNKGISIRDGFLVVIIGKPNTGKSSFINNISGKDISIVTKQAGTTRDLIESFVDIGGYPVKFVDTAGIRSSKNIVEKIGVQKAITISKESHLNLIFIDNAKDIDKFTESKNTVFIKSKQDISGEAFKEKNYFNISSKTNFGIEKIIKIIKDNISNQSMDEKTYISRERHVTCLRNTLFYLERSKENKNIDLFAEDIRLATKSVSGLFGNVDIEDILDIIFSDFCIGK